MMMARVDDEHVIDLSHSPHDNDDDDDNSINEEESILLKKKSSSSSLILHHVEPFQIDESEQASVSSSSSSSSSSHHGVGNLRRRNRRKRRRRRHHKPSTPRQALLRYFILSTVAVILTISCPKTILRTTARIIDNDNDDSGISQSHINKQRLVQVILVYLLTLLTFYILHGSDPGYITKEIMQQVCLQDGYSLLGQRLRQDGDDGDGGGNEDNNNNKDDPKVGQNNAMLMDHHHHHRSHSSSSNHAAARGSEEQQQQVVMIRRNQSASLLSFTANGKLANSTTSVSKDDDDDPLASPPLETPLPPPNSSSATTTTRASTTRRKVCKHCQFAPPLRSHHCRICNKNCVAMFDHHCDFVGTCIGERNHCRFWWFLTCQALAFHVCCNMIVGSSQLGFTNVFMMLFSSTASSSSSPSSPSNSAHHYSSSSNVSNNANDMHPTNEGFHRYDVDVLVAVLAKIYLYPLMVLAFIMWGVHTFMALCNTTTFEFFKGPGHLEYLKGTNQMDMPFSKRLDQNLQFFCCQRDDAAAAAASQCGHFFFCSSLGGPRHANNDDNKSWRPTVWLPPGKIIRDSEDWWEHPWQNKYWSCC